MKAITHLAITNCVLLFFTVNAFCQNTFSGEVGSADKSDNFASLSVKDDESILLTTFKYPGLSFLDSTTISTYLIKKDNAVLWSRNYIPYMNGMIIHPEEFSFESAITKDYGSVTGFDYKESDKNFIMLFKTDNTGKVIWTKRMRSKNFSEYNIFGVAEFSNGDIVVGSNKRDTTVDKSEAIGLMRFNSAGTLLWQTTVKPASNLGKTYFASTCLTITDNNIIVGGSYLYNQIGYRPAVTTFDLNGRVVAFRQYQASASERASFSPGKIFLNNDNNINITGLYQATNANGQSRTYYYSSVFSQKASKLKVDFFNWNDLDFQHYALTHSLKGKQFYDRQYIAKDGGLYACYNIFTSNTQVSVNKYDSLGKICPDYTYSQAGPGINQVKFSITDTVNSKISDKILIDSFQIVEVNENYFSSLCSGTAPSIAKTIIDRQNIASIKMSVFPNPVRDILHIQTNGSVSFSLLNQAGKILLTANINGSGTIDVSKITTGVYYLKNNSNGEVKKVVVSR